ncbi:hypothetical protein STEG23_011617 [Scotinomys teguina]
MSSDRQRSDDESPSTSSVVQMRTSETLQLRARGTGRKKTFCRPAEENTKLSSKTTAKLPLVLKLQVTLYQVPCVRLSSGKSERFVTGDIQCRFQDTSVKLFVCKFTSMLLSYSSATRNKCIEAVMCQIIQKMVFASSESVLKFSL